MNFDTSFAVPHMLPSDNATEIANRTKMIDSMRSAENIRLWSLYLPEDCVR